MMQLGSIFVGFKSMIFGPVQLFVNNFVPRVLRLLKVETFHPAFYIGCPFFQVPVSLWAFKKSSSSLLHFFIRYIKAAAAMEVSYD
jgi:hypothetical protein